MSPFATESALQAHQRLARRLPGRSYSPLGYDRMALEKAGFTFRDSTDPKATVPVRERVLRSLLALGGKATLTAIADHSGVKRTSVRFAVDGLIEREMIERANPADSGVGVYRARTRSAWDD